MNKSGHHTIEIAKELYCYEGDGKSGSAERILRLRIAENAALC